MTNGTKGRVGWVMVLAVSLVMAAGLAMAQPPVLQDLAAGKAIGQVRMAGNEVAVDALVPYDHARLMVRERNGGVVFEKQYSADDPLTYGMVDSDGKPLPDGEYVYEFALAKSPQRDKDGAITKVFLPMTASGRFRVVSGMARQIPTADTKSGGSMARPAGDGVQVKTTNPYGNHFVGDLTASAGVCSGCSDGDPDLTFGELLVKDGVPYLTMRDTNDDQRWRWYTSVGNLFLTSAALDGTGSTTPFKIEAGSPNNSFVITDTGAIGMGTSTPGDALHVLAAKTVIRLENTISNTTWRMGDFLDGSFRFNIATNGQGGPTGDVLFLESATGNVGIGTSTPASRLNVEAASASDLLLRLDGAGGKQIEHTFFDGSERSGRLIAAMGNTAGNRYFGFLSYRDQDANPVPIRFFTLDSGGTLQDTLYLSANQAAGQPGNVGIGRVPSYPLHMKSGAHVTVGGVWTNASSRDYKENIADLPTDAALAAVMGLEPVTFDYKHTGGEHHAGFIAEDVPDLVATPDRKSLSTMDIVAVLTKVVQQQQQTISAQEERINALGQKLDEVLRQGK